MSVLVFYVKWTWQMDNMALWLKCNVFECSTSVLSLSFVWMWNWKKVLSLKPCKDTITKGPGDLISLDQICSKQGWKKTVFWEKNLCYDKLFGQFSNILYAGKEEGTGDLITFSISLISSIHLFHTL